MPWYAPEYDKRTLSGTMDVKRWARPCVPRVTALVWFIVALVLGFCIGFTVALVVADIRGV